MPNDENSQTGACLNAVAVKLPDFWPEQAAVWFAQTEAQFAIKNITQQGTKFYYVVSSLPQQVAIRVLDIISLIPPSDPYDVLKARLLQTFTSSNYQRAEQLVSLPLLSDQRPSELMDKMLALLPPGEQPGFLFKYHFLHRLPSEMRCHLVDLPEAKPRELALKADKLWGHSTHSFNISATSVPAYEHSEACAVSRRSQPTSSTRRSAASDSMCWYHRNWGEAAKKCIKPCTFKASGNGRADGVM